MPKRSSRAINEVGNEYGHLTVLKRVGSNKWNAALWLCQCDCGNQTIVSGRCLRRRNTKSCGHLLGKARPFGRFICEGCRKEKEEDEYYSRGRCQACYRRWYSQENKELMKQSRERHYIKCHTIREYFFRNLLSKTKSRAKRKELPFDLTRNFLIALDKEQEHSCYYTKGPMGIEQNDRDAVSLDRIDPRRGYTQDNVRLVRSVVNNMKYNLSEDDFLNECIKVVSQIQNRKGG